MKVLVSGPTGLIGSALIDFLAIRRFEIVRLSRSVPETGEPTVQWDPAEGMLHAAALTGLDAVVHLAGESIAAGRWSAARKERIRASRVDGTRLLCETLAGMADRPRTLVCASAVGIYGDRGDEVCDEDSAAGTGFLADVVRDWEAATAAAIEAGIRVVHLRTGVVLSPSGGALAKMLLPFEFGLGGRVGSGRQYMSWITLDDLVGVIDHALSNETLRGPVNAVSPEAVTNRVFTKALGRALRRPTLLPLPAFLVRLLFGEMGRALLLASTRVAPTRLTQAGYEVVLPDLEGALRDLLRPD